MANRIRLGLIGASVRGTWSARAHLPALRASGDIELTAVCTTRADRSLAARAFLKSGEIADSAADHRDEARRVKAAHLLAKLPDGVAIVMARAASLRTEGHPIKLQPCRLQFPPP